MKHLMPLALVVGLSACGGGGSDTSGTAVVPAPAASASPVTMPQPAATATALSLTGATSPVHDPAILSDNGVHYLFATGNNGDAEGLLALRTSTDLTEWTLHGGSYAALPAWAARAVPGAAGMWAPDISKRGGEYRLYYSISTFGSNRSAIGLATATTIDPARPAANWIDKGPVIQSTTSDNYNAIDPMVFEDNGGRLWMTFGSFWSGIKLIGLDPATGMRLAGDTLRSIASRPSPGAVEAPFVIRHGSYYYLFVSFDSCCRGAASTYSTVVGRATAPTGPYLDRAGRDMMAGGGTVVLESGQGTASRYVGRGHVAVLQGARIGGTTADVIVYHASDTQRNGAPTLQTQRLAWDADGWPSAQ